MGLINITWAEVVNTSSNVSTPMEGVSLELATMILEWFPIMIGIIIVVNVLIAAYRLLKGFTVDNIDMDGDDGDGEDYDFRCRRCFEKCFGEDQEHVSGCCDKCGCDPLCDNCLINKEDEICKVCFEEMAKEQRTKNKVKELVKKEPLIVKSKKPKKKPMEEIISTTKEDEDKFIGKNKFE